MPVVVSKICVVPEVLSAKPTDTTEPEVGPLPDEPTLEMRNNVDDDSYSEISVGSIAASDVSATSRNSKRKRARKSAFCLNIDDENQMLHVIHHAPTRFNSFRFPPCSGYPQG